MTATKTRFRIIPFINPSRKEVFRVTGCMANGKQIRENFPTMAAATVRHQELEREYQGLPQLEMNNVQTKLSRAQIDDAEAALHRLNGKASLADVAEFYLTHYREPLIKMPLVEAFSKFIKDKTAANRRGDTLRNLNDRIGRLCKLHAEKMTSDVMQHDIEEFIAQPGKGLYARISDRSVLSGFFRWCVKQKFCQVNPVENIQKIKVDQTRPSILTLIEARKLVAAAEGYKDGACLPYVVLGMFCAIRPAELSRLTWEDVDLKARTVTIQGATAKKRKFRSIEVSSNAAHLLTEAALAKKPIRGKNWRRDFDSVKTMAGFCGRDKGDEALKPWGADIMRHTGVTYHLALHKNEGRTAEWAGNSPDVIQTHYKALTNKADISAFWKIGNPPKAKIIKLKAA